MHQVIFMHVIESAEDLLYHEGSVSFNENKLGLKQFRQVFAFRDVFLNYVDSLKFLVDRTYINDVRVILLH